MHACKHHLNGDRQDTESNTWSLKSPILAKKSRLHTDLTPTSPKSVKKSHTHPQSGYNCGRTTLLAINERKGGFDSHGHCSRYRLVKLFRWWWIWVTPLWCCWVWFSCWVNWCNAGGKVLGAQASNIYTVLHRQDQSRQRRTEEKRIHRCRAAYGYREVSTSFVTNK